MEKSKRRGPWQRILERYCKVLGILLVIEKVESSSSECYRVVLTSPDSVLFSYLDASFSGFDSSRLGAKLVYIRKKDTGLVTYATCGSSAERACKKHLFEMLGNDLKIWRDRNDVEASFLAHVPDTIDTLKIHLDLAEGSRESCQESRCSV